MRQKPDYNADDKHVQNADLERNVLERDIKMGEICLIIINGLLLVTTIVIACIYYGQLQQMTKATKATEDAATAAKESADLTRQQIVTSQAAILGIRFDVLFRFLPGEAHGLRSIVEYRSGSAIANNIHVNLDASWTNAPGLTDVGEPLHVEYDIPAMRQQNSRADVHMIPLQGLTMETWEPIRQKTTNRTIVVKGSFHYNNGFDPVPEQHFCFVYFAHPEVLGSSAADFIECKRYASTAEMFTGLEKRAKATMN